MLALPGTSKVTLCLLEVAPKLSVFLRSFLVVRRGTCSPDSSLLSSLSPRPHGSFMREDFFGKGIVFISTVGEVLIISGGGCC